MTATGASEDIEVWVSNPNSPISDGKYGGFDGTGEVETQSKATEKALNAIQASSSEFIESWKKACHAVSALFAADNGGEQGGFRLESMKVKLSISASGKISFVGELGGEVAFEAEFKRRDSGISVSH